MSAWCPQNCEQLFLLQADPTNPRTVGEAGYMFAATGHIGEARKLLATLNEMVNQGSTYPTFAGLIYVGLGQRSKALAALEENAKIAGIGGVFLYHAFDELKDDPRYQSLIAEMQQGTHLRCPSLLPGGGYA